MPAANAQYSFDRKWQALGLLLLFALAFPACNRRKSPNPGYHEYAYVSNGKSDSVSVIDVLAMRNIRTIAVGRNPTGLAANPKKNEIYVANSESNNVSVIDAERNEVVATIGVHRAPYFVSVSADGKRAYVANSGSSNVSVIDLESRKVIATIRVGNAPGLAKVSADGNLVVVSNRNDDTASIIDTEKLAARDTAPVCHQPQDVVILPDSSKAFVACPGSNQVASIDLKSDRVLTLLEVGKTPIQMALKSSSTTLTRTLSLLSRLIRMKSAAVT